MNPYTIRKIEQKDNPQMASIIRKVMTEFGACGTGFSIQDKEVDFMYEHYQERATYYVVEKWEDGKSIIYGGAGIAVLVGAEKEDVCELKKMYFLSEIRGLGLAKKILDYCFEDAKKLGYKKMYLETLSSMKSAIAFYKNNGFIQIPQAMGNTGHFSCDLFFVKDVS